MIEMKYIKYILTENRNCVNQLNHRISGIQTPSKNCNQFKLVYIRKLYAYKNQTYPWDKRRETICLKLHLNCFVRFCGVEKVH